MIDFIFFGVIFMTFSSSCFGQTTPSGIHDSTIWTPYYLSSTTGYNFNDNQERFARQLQASFQNLYNNGNRNDPNQHLRNSQNPFERQNENNRYDNRQNGQQQQQQNGYEYPSQFFQQRRGDNLNNQNPNNQFGQQPFGSSSYQQNGNQGQYRRPQPYEQGFYQATTTPQSHYGIGGQQRIIQEFQQRQTGRQHPNNYGNQPPQGLGHQQQGAYNHENQGGLSEYLRQVHQGMYGRKK